MTPRYASRTLQAQIAEVERELKMRADVYPRLVASRKMSHGNAEEATNLMRNVLQTLRWVDAHKDAMIAQFGKPEAPE